MAYRLPFRSVAERIVTRQTLRNFHSRLATTLNSRESLEPWSARFAKQLSGTVRAVKGLVGEAEPLASAEIDAATASLARQLFNLGLPIDSLYRSALELVIDDALRAILKNPGGVAGSGVEKLWEETFQRILREKDGEPLFDLFHRLSQVGLNDSGFQVSSPGNDLARLKRGAEKKKGPRERKRL